MELAHVADIEIVRREYYKESVWYYDTDEHIISIIDPDIYHWGFIDMVNFLHECGHANLKHKPIETEDRKSAELLIKQEKEAWKYAISCVKEKYRGDVEHHAFNKMRKVLKRVNDRLAKLNLSPIPLSYNYMY